MQNADYMIWKINGAVGNAYLARKQAEAQS